MNVDETNWLTEIHASEQRQRDRLPAAKAAILSALKATRAAIVTIPYDGVGDNGQIDGVEAESAAGKPVKLRRNITVDFDGEARKCDLEEALIDFAWTVLRVHHDGFENEDGGYGTLTIDVRKGTVTLDHNDRFTEVSNTLTEV